MTLDDPSRPEVTFPMPENDVALTANWRASVSAVTPDRGTLSPEAGKAAVLTAGGLPAAVDTPPGDEIVKQAAANHSKTVVIAPRVAGSVTRTEVSIPAAVRQIGSRSGARLTVSTPVAEVSIPNGGLASLAGPGGTVTMAAEKTGNTLELSVTAGGRTVERVPGGLTLTVPAECTAP